MSFNQGIVKSRSTIRPDVTVKELKEQLRAQSKATTGTKDQLLTRINDPDAPKYKGPGRPKGSQDTDQRDIMKDFKKRAPPAPSEDQITSPDMLSDAQMRALDVSYAGTKVGHNKKTLYVFNKNKPKAADKPAKSKDPQLGAFVAKSIPKLMAQGQTRKAATKKAFQMYKEQSKAKSPKAVASPVGMLATTNDKKRARDDDSDDSDDSDCESMFGEQEMTILDRNVGRFFPEQLKMMIKHLKSGDSPKVHEVDWNLVREYNEMITENNDDDKIDNDSQVQSDEDDDEEDADFEEEEEEEESGSESGADSDDEADDM